MNRILSTQKAKTTPATRFPLITCFPPPIQSSPSTTKPSTNEFPSTSIPFPNLQKPLPSPNTAVLTQKNKQLLL